MKRIYLWLRELSLYQQLLTIAFLVITVFIVFLFTFLSPQITTFMENEMYRFIHASQHTVAYYLDEYPTDYPKSTFDSDEIVHMVWDYDEKKFELIEQENYTAVEIEEVLKMVDENLTGVKDFSLSIVDASGKSRDFIYSVYPLEGKRFLISKILPSYEVQFRNGLMNNIVDINIIVVSVLFMLLMIWVASLIHPLNQIKTYITKIKNDEPADLNVNRRDEIGEVADALTDMEEELQKQTREKEEMIQNISHDLKTPIATIRSYGESIKDGIYPYGTLEKSIDVIIEHANRLEKKVQSLIALNKMGYLLDDCEEGDHLDMNAVIDKVLLSLKVIRPEITFTRETDPNVKFHGDEEPWRIVVENLIDNALRYAKSHIRIELHEGELLVSNDGPPISKERMEKLFKPYEKGTDGQFGLGLSIVYKVASTYGYHVEAENRQGEVCFRVYKEISKKELREKQKETKRDQKKSKKSKKEKEKA
ncbi:MAG: HAMP domain-containing histidine kinase [Solobacterium sp.]|nr:HAMP domain-containing histidine kinase [Solobacterium sp.]